MSVTLSCYVQLSSGVDHNMTRPMSACLITSWLNVGQLSKFFHWHSPKEILQIFNRTLDAQLHYLVNTKVKIATVSMISWRRPNSFVYMWLSNSPDMNPVECKISRMMQQRSEEHAQHQQAEAVLDWGVTWPAADGHQQCYLLLEQTFASLHFCNTRTSRTCESTSGLFIR